MLVTTIGDLKARMSGNVWADYCRYRMEQNGFDPNTCEADEEVALDRFEVYRFGL